MSCLPSTGPLTRVLSQAEPFGNLCSAHTEINDTGRQPSLGAGSVAQGSQLLVPKAACGQASALRQLGRHRCAGREVEDAAAAHHCHLDRANSLAQASDVLQRVLRTFQTMGKLWLSRLAPV